MLAARRRWLAALAAASLAALAGCGGGRGSTSSATAGGAPLTKQELIAKGDAICKQANERFAQLQQNPPTTPQTAATFARKVIDNQRTELRELRALDAPPSVQASLDAYLKALDRNVNVLRQGLKAARRSDAAAYAQAQAKTVSQQVERLQLARAVGFDECSRPAGSAAATPGG